MLVDVMILEPRWSNAAYFIFVSKARPNNRKQPTNVPQNTKNDSQ
jgi:hypothetical protein